MTTAHQNIPTIRDQLSAKIVSYCKERCLHLDGMALRLESGEPMDADMCDAISAYCAAKSLTLGDLLPEVEALFAAYLAQDAEYQAYQEELDAEDWDRSCRAMKRAEENFGY